MRIGKITENALKRSVLKQIKTEFKNETSAAVGTDCAFSKEKKTFSTICPVTENISDSGYYAVVKAVNGLLVQGIKPEQVNLSILLPPDAEEAEIKQIVKVAIEASRLSGVIYTGGHTEVTGSVNRPVITAVCTGSEIKKGAEHLISGKAKAGDFLVISKWIGMEGSAMLAKEKFEELKTKYPAPFIDDAADFKRHLCIAEDMDVAIAAGITAAHDLSNGGVFAGLWEIAQKQGLGLKADLRSIPVRQETIEICEFFELNPYQLLSGGAVIFATDNGEKLATALLERGIPAAVVGQLSEGKGKTLVNADETRFLDLPQSDEIHRILN